MDRPEPGIFLVHKPAGETSFGVVRGFEARLAAAPGKRHKLCHGGALDPFAHGLLLVLVGPATRLFDFLHDVPKRYLATVAWGAETDSGDGLGAVTARGEAAPAAALDEALARLLGWTEQVPPVMSNKRVDGERAHVRARRGEAVELAPQRVYLHQARFLSHQLPQRSTLELVCRGGFYVRALARDVGRAAGCRAHLEALHRTAIGPWEDPGPGAERRVSGEALLPWLPARRLGDDEWGVLRRGQPIARGALEAPAWPLPAGFPPGPELIGALHQQRLVAVLEPRDGQLATRMLVER